MYIKKQSFLVAGLSKSGAAATNFLLSKGAKVYCFDDFENNSVLETKQKLAANGAIILNQETLESALENIDILLISPGVPIDNNLPVTFKSKSKRIIGEMELATLFITAPVIAISGTNGKTTTASMIDKMLNDFGLESVLCGNIGTPVCDVVEKINKACAVMEVSSFQLETLNSLRPHISVLTNITPDHLDRHYNMQNYTYLKAKLLTFLKESEYAVLNYDDDILRQLALSTRAKVVYFSRKDDSCECYLKETAIYCKGDLIVDTNDLIVKGKHNIENAMAAILCAKIMGVSNKDIAESLINFKGVRHRIEFAGEINGVKYFNDSKGTNIGATISAAKSMDSSTVLLLGGRDKGYDYCELFENLKNLPITYAIIYGENRFKITESAKKMGFNNISICDDLEIAIKLAHMLAKENDNVLLSPASSSFDMFANYEQRGDFFIKKVAELNNETKA